MSRATRTAAAHELAGFLADTTWRLRGLGSGAFITLPAPRGAAPERLWWTQPERPAWFWDGGSQTSVGIDEALSFALSEPSETALAALQPQIDACFARLMIVRHPGVATVNPTVWGGAAFDRARPIEPAWQAFGTERFSLPRWSYRADARGASLSLALLAPHDFLEPDRWVEAFVALYEALTADPAPWPDPPPLRHVEQLSREAWRTLVEAIQRGIHDGRFDKVVLARGADLRFEAPLDPVVVLARLAQRAPITGSYRFGLRREGCSFLGLTPELLLAKRGRAVRSEALAGSTGPGEGAHDRAERRRWLLNSSKDRGEHRVVVDELRRRLRPLAADLDIPEHPVVRELTEILHLATPIRATLDGEVSVLALIDALAPTPSVGGHPSGSALSFLRDCEPVPRGWYAGPVGWIDAEGDGEIAIGIRSALLDRGRALVFAGAGIVRDSEAEAEFEETAIKQRSLFGALGIVG